ncbi:unnamed protein product [Calypogeia fissa]
MMMYNSAAQQPQRYGRAKGLKVKHLVQLVVLTVLFTWFLYQLNNSHKAKVRSQRAEKENDIDDELLISEDNGGIDHTGVDRDEITKGVVAQDEFIDKTSVSKSRKTVPDLKDAAELEQSIAEGDRVETLTEEVFDDSGEGDRDERGANSDDHVRRTDETDFETKEREKRSVLGEEYNSLPDKRATETAEDRGDGEDEVQTEISTGEEFDGGEGWAVLRNSTENGEDDTLIYLSNEKSKEKGIDVSEIKTSTDSIEANTDHKKIPDEEAEVAESMKAESSVLLSTTLEDWKKNLDKPDDSATIDLAVADETKSEGTATQDSSEETEANKNFQNGEMPTIPSDTKSDEVALVLEGHSKESNVTEKMNELSEMTGDSAIFQQDGADAEAEQGRGTGMLGDGQDESLPQVKQDELVQQEAIFEVVSVGKQNQSLKHEAIAEVVSVDKQDKAEGA